MTGYPVKAESETLSAVATVDVRTKCPVFLYPKGDFETPIEGDELNLASASARADLVARLPQQLHNEAAPLLLRLAALVAQEQTRHRSKNETAGAEQGRAVVFPTIEPWPDEVDGATVLDDVAAMLRRFVVMSDAARDGTALWVLNAHAHEAAQVSPLLNITSPERRCGKTTLGIMIGALVPRPLNSANLTLASVFRVIELYRPTVIADEVDTYLPDRNELRGLLNSGHLRAGATFLRTVGDDHEPRMFSTWAPKVLLGINTSRLHTTLIDRSIVIQLQRRAATEPVAPLRLDRVDAMATPFRQKLARWVNDHLDALRAADPVVPDSLNDRAADNWRSLIAIADRLGKDWPARARRAAVMLSGGSEMIADESPGVLLLGDLRQFFSVRSLEKARTEDILVWLHSQDERSWSAWNKGRALTAQGLSRLLKPYKIRPKSVRFSGAVLRGYELGQFADAFERYLPSDPLHTLHPSNGTTYAAVGPATPSPSVADAQHPNALRDNAVADVADPEPPREDRGEAWEPPLDP